MAAFFAECTDKENYIDYISFFLNCLLTFLNTEFIFFSTTQVKLQTDEAVRHFLLLSHKTFNDLSNCFLSLTKFVFLFALHLTIVKTVKSTVCSK